MATQNCLVALFFCFLACIKTTSDKLHESVQSSEPTQFRPSHLLDPDELKFTYNPKQPKSLTELRSIKCPVRRARASKPDDFREVKVTHGKNVVYWKTLDHTNAQFIDYRLRISRVASNAYRKREREDINRNFEQTGKKRITISGQGRRRQYMVAKQGEADAPMPTFRNGQARYDSVLQSKAEWIEKRRKMIHDSKERYKQRQKRLKMIPDLNIPFDASKNP